MRAKYTHQTLATCQDVIYIYIRSIPGATWTFHASLVSQEELAHSVGLQDIYGFVQGSG